MADTLNRRTLYRAACLHDVGGDARILYNVAGDDNLDPAVTPPELQELLFLSLGNTSLQRADQRMKSIVPW